MKMIVGLGNPGSKYLMTRHNAGFLVLDALASRLGITIDNSEQKAFTKKIKLDNSDVLLVKPQTFMNLSGESVLPLLKYYKVDPSNLLVVHDEVDLPFGSLKFQFNRGHGGHNGIRSVHDLLQTKEYARLRIGISRPPHPEMGVADYALQNFSKVEQNKLVDILSLAAEGIECFIQSGLNLTATRYNTDSK